MDYELMSMSTPHSVEAEQAVLGSMLINSRCVAEVMEVLVPGDFYIGQNRDIYDAIHGMFTMSQRIDPVTILDRMRADGTYDDKASRPYMMQLMEITPTSANVMEYASIVKEMSTKRKLLDAVESIAKQIREGCDGSILELAEQKIYGIRQGEDNSGLVHVSHAMQEVYTRLEEASQNGGSVPGLSTGLSDLDHAIAGLNNSDLIYLAARPGMGKTSLALNMLLHAGKFSGKNVAIFSLEMSREQLAMRLLSNEAFIDNKKLVLGDLDDKDWGEIALANSSICRTNIYIADNPMITVADMLAKCRRLDNLGLVVIDYLQLMQSADGRRSSENRQQVISDISRSLKIMAKELNVPVLCLSQLSRACEIRSDKRPMLSDLRESGSIEQDADIVLFIYRDDYYNQDSAYPNLAELIVAKNRHGETGRINVQWIPEYTTFAGIDRTHTEG